MDVPHVWGHNAETKAQIKKLKTCWPPPLVIVSGETNIASIWRAISARRRLLSKTNYKNIILEILIIAFWQKKSRKHNCVGGHTFVKTSEVLLFVRVIIPHPVGRLNRKVWNLVVDVRDPAEVVVESEAQPNLETTRSVPTPEIHPSASLLVALVCDQRVSFMTCQWPR